MKITNFRRHGQDKPRFGLQILVHEESYLIDVAVVSLHLFPEKDCVLESGPYESSTNWNKQKVHLQALHDACLQTLVDSSNLHLWLIQGWLTKEEQADFLSPVLRPRNIFLLGSNYPSHVNEKKHRTDRPNVSVEKFDFPNATAVLAGSLAGHNWTIPYPSRTSQLDYEGELVIVIGAECKNVKEADARSVVFGYTVCNDLSMRDVQYLEMKRGLCMFGKSYDRMLPVGPYIVTSEDLPDVQDLEIKTTVNGEVRQQDRTKNVIYTIEALVSYFSQVTLYPGDLILTGTPAGVGINREPPENYLLKPGDLVEVEIEKIGKLSNKIVGEDTIN